MKLINKIVLVVLDGRSYIGTSTSTLNIEELPDRIILKDVMLLLEETAEFSFDYIFIEEVSITTSNSAVSILSHDSTYYDGYVDEMNFESDYDLEDESEDHEKFER